MEQALITFDQLPQHELNIIASFNKRAGKDALRSVNKVLNNKIISQDQLYERYEIAKQSSNTREMSLLGRYNTFIPVIYLEVMDAIEDNNEKLAKWCLSKIPCISTPFLEFSCVRAAIKRGNISMVKMLFGHCRHEEKYAVANIIVINAAQHGHLDIIKAFIESYKMGINFGDAIYFARDNGYDDIVQYLESKKPSYYVYRNAQQKKF